MSKFSFTFYLKFPGIITPGSQAGIGGGGMGLFLYWS